MTLASAPKPVTFIKPVFTLAVDLLTGSLRVCVAAALPPLTR